MRQTKHRISRALRLLLLAATAALAGCHSCLLESDCSVDSAEGQWEGDFDTDSDPAPATRRFAALVDGDGHLWLAYTGTGDDRLAGIVQGQGQSDDSLHRYTADITEREAGAARAGTLTAGYQAEKRLQGNATLAGPRHLRLNPEGGSNAVPAYREGPPVRPASLVRVDGLALAPAGRETATLVLDPAASDGKALFGRLGDGADLCGFISPLAPDSVARYFHLTLTFVPSAGCQRRGLAGSASGVLFQDSDNRYVLVSASATFGFWQD